MYSMKIGTIAQFSVHSCFLLYVCVMCNKFMLHIVMTKSAIWILGWTLHRSKRAGYHYMVMWSCCIFNTTHNTHSKPTVPIPCLKCYTIFSLYHTITFWPTLSAVTRCYCSCDPVRRSVSLDTLRCVHCHTGGLCLHTQHRTCN